MPTTVALDPDERRLLDHTHPTYIVGSGLSAMSPSWYQPQIEHLDATP